METLQINKKDALIAHQEAGPKTKVMLENLLDATKKFLSVYQQSRTT